MEDYGLGTPTEEQVKEKIEAEVPNEVRVRRLKAKGFSTHEIANRLGIQESEVKGILQKAYESVSATTALQESIEAYNEAQRELSIMIAMEMAKKNFECPYCHKKIQGLKVDNNAIINASKIKMDIQEKKLTLAREMGKPDDEKNPTLKQF